MTTVSNTLLDQAGDPAIGAVEIGLVAGDPEGGWDASAHRTYIARWRQPILAEDLGVWTVALQPNSSLSPSGTYYEVTERVEGTAQAKPLTTTYEISVPTSASTLYARDLLITPGTPPSASEASALAAHLAASNPHSGAAADPANTFSLYVDRSSGSDANSGRSEGEAKATLEAAVAVLPAGGGRILLRTSQAGHYDVAAPLVFTVPTFIEAMGPGFVSIRRTFNGTLMHWKANGGLRNVILDDDGLGAAARTGSAIKLSATDCTTLAGDCVFENIRITSSEAAGSWERILEIDGSNCTTAGIRRCRFTGCYFFGSRTVGETLKVTDAVHLFFNGGALVPAPTSVRQGVKILSSVGGIGSVDVHFAAFENQGDLDIADGQYVTWHGGRVGSNTGGVNAVAIDSASDRCYVNAVVLGAVDNDSTTSGVLWPAAGALTYDGGTTTTTIAPA